MARESWTVKNQTKKQLSIGDLQFVPTIDPGKQVNLLQYASKDVINQSVNLKNLLDVGWLKLIKKKDKRIRTLSKTKGEAGVVSVEENELDNYYTRSETYTKEEIDDLIGSVLEVKTVTEDYTPGDNDQVILVNASSKVITITLPSAVDNNNRSYYIKKIDSSNNDVIIDGEGNETIDEQSTVTLNAQYMCFEIASDGANWWII